MSTSSKRTRMVPAPGEVTAGVRATAHTAEFRSAERRFARFDEANAALKRIARER